MDPVRASLGQAFESVPSAKLGHLDRLPAELMSMVLRELDVRSLFRFRQVSRRARVLASALWEYALVSKHGLEGLRGLLRAGLAQIFTIDHLYRPLLTDKCSSCGAFGEYLFLFTAQRCCFNCLQSSPHYRVLPVSVFSKLARISPNQLGILLGPGLRTVPGIYNMLGTPARRPKHLLHEETATRTLLALGAIGPHALPRLTSRSEPTDQGFMATTAYPCYSMDTGIVERGVSCKGCQVRLERLRGEWDDPVHQSFSSQGFLAHFPRRLEAQQLWAESEGGTKSVNEPVLTRHCGFFSKFGPDGRPA